MEGISRWLRTPSFADGMCTGWGRSSDSDSDSDMERGAEAARRREPVELGAGPGGKMAEECSELWARAAEAAEAGDEAGETAAGREATGGGERERDRERDLEGE